MRIIVKKWDYRDCDELKMHILPNRTPHKR